MEQQFKDASSLFLWEDSADSSEVDRLLSHPHELDQSAVDDQEDARSCSSDDYYAPDLRALDFHDDGDQPIELISDGRPGQLEGMRRSGAVLEYNFEEEEEEEEESCNNVGVIRNMNEMEDKVFWDTCMAGGYP